MQLILLLRHLAPLVSYSHRAILPVIHRLQQAGFSALTLEQLAEVLHILSSVRRSKVRRPARAAMQAVKDKVQLYGTVVTGEALPKRLQKAYAHLLFAGCVLGIADAEVRNFLALKLVRYVGAEWACQVHSSCTAAAQHSCTVAVPQMYRNCTVIVLRLT